ncbi:hypothetical protein D3C76_1076000 [compost metagenome]
MISIVDPAGKRQEAYFAVDSDLDAGIPEFLDKRFRKPDTADRIKHEPDLHAGLRLLDQCLLNFAADVVRPVNVILHMYVMLGHFQFLQQGRERLLPVGQHPRPRRHGKRSSGNPLRHLQQSLLPWCKLRQIPGQHIAVMVDPFEALPVRLRFLIEFPPFEIVLPQQEIEHQANDRQQCQYKNPGHRTGRIAILHKDRKTDRDDSQGLKYTDQHPAEFTEDAESEEVKSKQDGCD